METTSWSRSCVVGLVGEGFTDGVNVLLRAQGGVVRVHLMAVDLGRLGTLLPGLVRRSRTALSRQPAEGSCSR
jgi:hypothetical protein